MRFDRTVLAPLTLATSLAGALVLTATLSAPAYAEGESAAAGPAASGLRASEAAIEPLAPPSARPESDAPGRDGLSSPGHR